MCEKIFNDKERICYLNLLLFHPLPPLKVKYGTCREKNVSISLILIEEIVIKLSRCLETGFPN